MNPIQLTIRLGLNPNIRFEIFGYGFRGEIDLFNPHHRKSLCFSFFAPRRIPPGGDYFETPVPTFTVFYLGWRTNKRDFGFVTGFQFLNMGFLYRDPKRVRKSKQITLQQKLKNKLTVFYWQNIYPIRKKYGLGQFFS